MGAHDVCCRLVEPLGMRHQAVQVRGVGMHMHCLLSGEARRAGAYAGLQHARAPGAGLAIGAGNNVPILPSGIQTLQGSSQEGYPWPQMLWVLRHLHVFTDERSSPSAVLLFMTTLVDRISKGARKRCHSHSALHTQVLNCTSSTYSVLGRQTVGEAHNGELVDRSRRQLLQQGASFGRAACAWARGVHRAAAIRRCFWR